MTEMSLFDVPEQPPVPQPPKLSPDQRRTARYYDLLLKGWHPFGDKLHPDAPPVDDRQAPGPRCRTCNHRLTGGYPKCDLHPITHGPGTDCRAWWPACTNYIPQEPKP
jgi:hypothetical protein